MTEVYLTKLYFGQLLLTHSLPCWRPVRPEVFPYEIPLAGGKWTTKTRAWTSGSFDAPDGRLEVQRLNRYARHNS
jgi:hypothetical protein